MIELGYIGIGIAILDLGLLVAVLETYALRTKGVKDD